MALEKVMRVISLGVGCLCCVFSWLPARSISLPFREDLRDRGISTQLNFTGETLSLVSGGIQPATHFNGLLHFHLGVNMEQTMGWHGGSLQANVFYFQGNDLSADFVGDFGVVSNILTPTEWNIFTVYLEQVWIADNLWSRLGQLAVDDDFATTETGALFLNANFGALPLISANVAAPIFALAAPGVVGRLRVSERFHVLLGVYTGDAGIAGASNHGFDWRLGGTVGYAVFLEGQVDYNAFDLPGILKVGGYHATGLFDDFADGGTKRGNEAYYIAVEQSLLGNHWDEPKIQVFTRLGISGRKERNVVHAYAECGMQFKWPFLQSKEGAMGVACSFTEFGDSYVEAENLAGNRVTGQEAVLEFTYRLELANEWYLQPDIQYIFDAHQARKDAWVVGLRTEMSF